MALVALIVTCIGTSTGRFMVHMDYGDKGMTKIRCGNLGDMLHTIRIWLAAIGTESRMGLRAMQLRWERGLRLRRFPFKRGVESKE